jgi:hypothetical protein
MGEDRLLNLLETGREGLTTNAAEEKQGRFGKNVNNVSSTNYKSKTKNLCSIIKIFTC